MKTLFSLPKYVFISVFRDWLTTIDIGYIDTALCSTRNRDRFIEFVTFNRLCLHSTKKAASLDYLQWLKIRNITLSDIVIEGDPNVDFCKIITQYFMNSLRDLHINSFCDNMLPILKACNKKNCLLVEIRFTDSHDINDKMIEEFLTKCPLLQSFSLCNCSSMTGVFTKSLLKNCPKLQTLEIKDCGNFSHFEVVKDCSLSCLTSLTITSCNAFDAYSIVPLLKQSVCVSYLNVDRILTLKNISDTLRSLSDLRRVGSYMGKEVIEILSTNCPLMESISLPHTMDEYDMISALQTWKHLTSLTINANKPISDALIDTIAVNCRQLSTLVIFGKKGMTEVIADIEYDDNKIAQVTDSAVVNLSQHCTQLRLIELVGFTAITDTSIIAIAVKCPQLETLNIAGCSLVTDTSMHFVISACSCLTSLDISNIPSTYLTSNTLFSFIDSKFQLNYFACCGSRFQCSTLCLFIESCCQNAASLRLCNLGYETNVENESVITAIVSSCLQLESLYLDRNTYLIVKSVPMIRLCTELQRLRFVSLKRCYMTWSFTRTKNDFNELIAQFNHIKFMPHRI